MLDQLLGAVSEQVQSGGLAAILKELTGAVVNRALEAELTAHLDYEDGEQPPEHQTNRRNGHRKKKLRTDLGEVEIKVPRDREGSFEPQLIRPYQRAVPGFEQKILSMYVRGLSDREISSHFAEIYSIDVGHDLISRVTDAVLGEMREWRDRPLQIRYPIVYLDALVVKVRDSGCVRNKSLYLVIGIDDEGRRDVLGMWLQDTEGAKFWLTVLTELRNRGVQDILFLCADGLAGLPEAVEVAFPETVFQTCVVHLIRSSTRLVPWKDKTAVCRDLKPIYTAPSIDAAEQALDAFEKTWVKKYPSVGKAWRPSSTCASTSASRSPRSVRDRTPERLKAAITRWSAVHRFSDTLRLEVAPQVLRDVVRVALQLGEVELRRVVEGHAGDLAQGDVDGWIAWLHTLGLEGLEARENLVLRGREHAVEPPNDEQRQDDLVVLVGLVRATQPLRVLPKEISDLAKAGESLGGVLGSSSAVHLRHQPFLVVLVGFARGGFGSSPATPPARTQSSTSESLNFQRRPILWVGSPRPSIHRYTESRATPRCAATSSTETHGSEVVMALAPLGMARSCAPEQFAPGGRSLQEPNKVVDRQTQTESACVKRACRPISWRPTPPAAPPTSPRARPPAASARPSALRRRPPPSPERPLVGRARAGADRAVG